MCSSTQNSIVNNPKVSVIMNCFNGEKYLKEAIDSVYAQTHSDWEIIFWDNDSTDRSAEIAKSYDNRLKYFKGVETVPLGKARNLAIEKAKGEYISFLDCDDIWLPTKLERQLSVFKANKEISLVFTGTTKLNKKGHSIGSYCDIKITQGNIFRELLRSNVIALTSVMVCKKALDSLEEVFDERFTMAEDWDLWLRLCYVHKASYLNELLTKWRVHSESLTHKKFALYGIETRYIIEKLKQLHATISEKYSKELDGMLKKSMLYEGLGLWFENKRHDAREKLKPYIFNNRKVFIIFVITYMPSKLAHILEWIYFKFGISRIF